MATQVHENKCPNCGDAVDPAMKFCGSCGSKVSVQTFTGTEAVSNPHGTTVDIKRCPSCNAALETANTKCDHCGNHIIITTFNSVHAMPLPMVGKYAEAYRKALAENPDSTTLGASIAFCYLKLKLYDKALGAFEEAHKVNFDNPEIPFYAAVCLLGGKKAFLAQRPAIDRIEEYINSALMIEPTRGIYHYFRAYIKYDYFSRKFYNTSPTWQEALAAAQSAGEAPSPHDIVQLYGILGVERPGNL